MEVCQTNKQGNLWLDFLKYAKAICELNSYRNQFKYCENFGYTSDFNEQTVKEFKEWQNKPLFNPNIHSEFSPNLSDVEIEGLKDPDLFTKEELITIINTLILDK